MRRSPLLTVQVLCPHFERPVYARKNETADRLVDCASKEECATTEPGTTIVIYPKGCPVFRVRA